MNNFKIRHILTIGFALFAMFFGAGNLILPPYIGLSASSEWLIAMIGFGLSAILGPLLGVLAVVKSGENFTDLGKKVNVKFCLFLGLIIMLIIGPLVAIPRTGATTYEIGLLPIFSNMTARTGSILFFSVTLVLSISKSKIVDIIGNILTPLLLLLLVFFIVRGILNPSHLDLVSHLNPLESFSFGFQEGYQTLDTLASVIFAGIIISAVKAKGYNTVADRSKVSTYASLLSVLCLFFVYGGLLYLGATSGYPLTDDVSRSNLLLHISNRVLGEYGTYAISLCISLACLTTSIALTSAVGYFFERITKGFISYKLAVVISCLISAFISVEGIDSIITYAFPVLMFVYPITLVLVIYVFLFGHKIKSKTPFILAVCITTFISFLEMFKGFFPGCSFLNFLEDLPGYKYKLEWVIPSIFGFVSGIILDQILRKKK